MNELMLRWLKAKHGWWSVPVAATAFGLVLYWLMIIREGESTFNWMAALFVVGLFGSFAVFLKLLDVLRTRGRHWMGFILIIVYAGLLFGLQVFMAIQLIDALKKQP